MRIGIAALAVGVAIVACGPAVDAFCPSPGYSKVRPRASLLQQILIALWVVVFCSLACFTHHPLPNGMVVSWICNCIHP